MKEPKERTVEFKKVEINPKNEEKIMDREGDGMSKEIYPRDTWGSSDGGRPRPVGNLEIFFTLSNSR